MEIVDRFFLRVAMRFIVLKLHLMSLANGNNIKHVPIPKVVNALTITIKSNTSMYSIITATKNPMGFFVSNGTLWIKMKRNQDKNEVQT